LPSLGYVGISSEGEDMKNSVTRGPLLIVAAFLFTALPVSAQEAGYDPDLLEGLIEDDSSASTPETAAPAAVKRLKPQPQKAKRLQARTLWLPVRMPTAKKAPAKKAKSNILTEAFRSTNPKTPL